MIRRTGIGASVIRGGPAGLAGAHVMAAFREPVETPLTGCADSYAPARFTARPSRLAS